MERFWVCVGILVAAQCAGLVAYSHYLFAHFDLTEDFAHNAQAWFLIGHGNLSPLDTVRIPPTPFWRDHVDLILWPLSLLGQLDRSPFVLLVAQDLAIVAAEVVTIVWIVAISAERLAQGWQRTSASMAATVLLIANPWWYEAASFDVHLPPLGLFLVVLSAYSLWCGRNRRAVIAALLCTLFGVVVVELVAVIGLAGLWSRRVRHSGGLSIAFALSGAAAIWVVGTTAIGANQASNLSQQFSYLAGTSPHAGALSIFGGVVSHPSRVLRVLESRWHPVARIFLTTGVVGVLSPWGALVSLGILLPAVLASSPTYITVDNGFQTLPAVPFLVVGTVLVLTQLGRCPMAPTDLAPAADQRWRFPPARSKRRRTISFALAFVVLAGGLFQDLRVEATIPRTWLRVSGPAAATLLVADQRIPASAEVIASNGVMGRFADRRFIYPLEVAPQTVTAHSHTVVFVITSSQGVEALSGSTTRADIGYLLRTLHARTLATSNGIAVLEWRPQTVPMRVTLP